MSLHIYAQKTTEKVEGDCPTATKNRYHLPTFIGADTKQQQALFKKLSIKTPLTLAEERQLLLVQLALLANSDETTLSRLQKLEQSLTEYLKQHKSDAELMTAKGSVIALQSLQYKNNLGKMNFLSRKGMRLMDRAIKKHPDHLGARLLRGLSYANMPAFLNRASFAKEDLSLVKKHIPSMQNPDFTEFVDYYLSMAVTKTQGADK